MQRAATEEGLLPADNKRADEKSSFLRGLPLMLPGRSSASSGFSLKCCVAVLPLH
jgi:hypothetical protein